MNWFWDVVSIVVIVVVAWYFIQEARHANSLGRLYVAIPAVFAFGGPRREPKSDGEEATDEAGRMEGSPGRKANVATMDGWEFESDRRRRVDGEDELGDPASSPSRSVFDLLGLESLVQMIAEPPVEPVEAPNQPGSPLDIEVGNAVDLETTRQDGPLGEGWSPRSDDTSYLGVMAPRNDHDHHPFLGEAEHGAGDYEQSEFDRLLNPDPDSVHDEKLGQGGWIFGDNDRNPIELEPWYNDPTDPRSPIYESWRDDPADPRNPLYRDDDR